MIESKEATETIEINDDIVENIVSFEGSQKFVDSLMKIMPNNSNINNNYEILKELMNKSITYINSVINKTTIDEIPLQCVGKTIVNLPDAQFIEPRGRFNTTIVVNGLKLEGKQLNCFIEWDSIADICLIPQSTSTTKDGEDLIAISLRKPMKLNNKQLKSIVWILSKSNSKPFSFTYDHISYNGRESSVIELLLKNVSQLSIRKPNNKIFQTVKSKKSFVRCYNSIQEGVLYPLENGLLFLKPMIFINVDEISSITAGRGGSTGSTRYIDLQIEMIDDKKYEFTNIEREELPALQAYVKIYLESRAKKLQENKVKIKEEDSVTNKTSKDNNNNNDDDDDDDDEEDEDYKPDDNSESDGDNSSSDSDDENDKDNESIQSSKKTKRVSEVIDLQDDENSSKKIKYSG